MNRDQKRTLHVQIENLTDAQAAAVEDMLATWVQLGGQGASRWTAFYADGDGNFHPTVIVNGRSPVLSPLITKEQRWHRPTMAHEMYWMDFDLIAWKQRQDASG